MNLSATWGRFIRYATVELGANLLLYRGYLVPRWFVQAMAIVVVATGLFVMHKYRMFALTQIKEAA
ncbi:MAG: hypothetical protein SCH71_10265 [Desulfobulbaceae bacterium]|nr:hypothetical protein [Desulfobulbaceae bacterium]